MSKKNYFPHQAYNGPKEDRFKKNIEYHDCFKKSGQINNTGITLSSQGSVMGDEDVQFFQTYSKTVTCISKVGHVLSMEDHQFCEKILSNKEFQAEINKRSDFKM